MQNQLPFLLRTFCFQVRYEQYLCRSTIQHFMQDINDLEHVALKRKNVSDFSYSFLPIDPKAKPVLDLNAKEHL